MHWHAATLNTSCVRVRTQVAAGSSVDVVCATAMMPLFALLQSLGIVEKAAKRAQKRARGQKVPA